MNVAIYTRCSTEEQNTELQKKHLKKFCKQRGFKIVKTYDDVGSSGGFSDRMNYLELIDDAQEGEFQGVVVYKIDRFSRNLTDLLVSLKALKQYDVKFFSATEPIDTDSIMGETLLQILGVFAEFERKMIKERQKHGIAEAKKKGVYKGRKPGALSKVQCYKCRLRRDRRDIQWFPIFPINEKLSNLKRSSNLVPYCKEHVLKPKVKTQ